MASKSTEKDLFESFSQGSESTRVSFKLDIQDATDDDCKDNSATPAKPMKRGISSLPTDTVALKKFKPTKLLFTLTFRLLQLSIEERLLRLDVP